MSTRHRRYHLFTASAVFFTALATFVPGVSASTSSSTVSVDSELVDADINSSGTHAYVTSYESGRVSRLNLATNKVDAVINTGPWATDIAINPAGTFAYVVGDEIISRINLATNKVDATIVINDSPASVAITADGAYAYVTRYDSGTVVRVDLAWNIVDVIIDVGDSPNAAEIHPAGTHMYVVNSYSGTVSRINLATNQVDVTIAGIGLYATDIDIHPSGTFAYVSNPHLGTILRINLAINQVDAVINVGATFPEDGDSTTSLNIDTSGTYAYVVNNNVDTMLQIDIRTNTIVATTKLGHIPSSITISPTNTFLITTSYESGTVVRTNIVATTAPNRPRGNLTQEDRFMKVAAAFIRASLRSESAEYQDFMIAGAYDIAQDFTANGRWYCAQLAKPRGTSKISAFLAERFDTVRKEESYDAYVLYVVYELSVATAAVKVFCPAHRAPVMRVVNAWRLKVIGY